jgi:FkbM family methyltransferase
MRRLPHSIRKRWQRLGLFLRGIRPGNLDDSTLLGLGLPRTPTILEIGCNDGYHTRMFLRLFPEARVFCFEPDARARIRFEEKTRDARVRLFPFAIGASNGTATFHASGGNPLGDQPHPDLPLDWDLSGSLRRPTGHLQANPGVRFNNTAAVEVRTLDDWAKEQGVETIDFIWADVQGAEMDLIQGARKTLGLTRFLYTEYNDHELYEGQPSLRQISASLPDFRIRIRYPDDVLFENLKLA